jgi:1-acyl-sn-glycerol-3-phosphate acyltransferase
MQNRAIAALRGVLTLVLLCLNTILWAVPIYVIIFAKLLVPHQGWRRRCGSAMEWLGSGWIGCNNLLSRLLQRIDWDITGVDNLDLHGSYLVSCNHQSWADVPILQKAFNGRIPFLKFFVKQQLIWVPILGGVWWAMDMPFMKRHSRAQIEKHPELRKQDVEATRRACERFLDRPVSLLNFLEGTRLTPAKHAAQESPYRHLLRPKAGGAAFALAALGGKIDTMLDVTIAYLDGDSSFWNFLCGRVRRITVTWVRELWERKDTALDRLLAESAGA